MTRAVKTSRTQLWSCVIGKRSSRPDTFGRAGKASAWLMMSVLMLSSLSGCWLMPPSNESVQSRQSKANLDMFSDPKARELALAAEQGRVEDVRRLMKDEGVNPDVHFSDEGYPLLFWPMFTENPKGLKAMLDNGADPNAKKLSMHQDNELYKGLYYDNAMVWAAGMEDPIYLTMLLDHGGDPNTRSFNDENLLFQAMIKQDQWQNVQLLVQRGAELNTRAGMLDSITGHYSGGGAFQRVYWLLEHGADPTYDPHPPPDTKTPQYKIMEAIFWHPGNPKNPEWQRKCQQWLLKRGHKRVPMPEHYRQMRKAFEFPSEEKDIPLL
jgi:hypothetical protein